jgi:hypothetical protein
MPARKDLDEANTRAIRFAFEFRFARSRNGSTRSHGSCGRIQNSYLMEGRHQGKMEQSKLAVLGTLLTNLPIWGKVDSETAEVL